MKIKLTQGKFAVVDDEDFERVSALRWYYEKCGTKGYAGRRSSKSSKNLRMHQFILGEKPGFVIDHIDGNGLNNKKINLRFVDKIINGLNRRQVKGFCSKKGPKPYYVRIQVHGKIFTARSFSSQKEALKFRQTSIENIIKKLQKELT